MTKIRHVALLGGRACAFEKWSYGRKTKSTIISGAGSNGPAPGIFAEFNVRRSEVQIKLCISSFRLLTGQNEQTICINRPHQNRVGLDHAMILVSSTMAFCKLFKMINVFIFRKRTNTYKLYPKVNMRGNYYIRIVHYCQLIDSPGHGLAVEKSIDICPVQYIYKNMSKNMFGSEYSEQTRTFREWAVSFSLHTMTWWQWARRHPIVLSLIQKI